MKKIICMTIILASFSLAGCSKEKEDKKIDTENIKENKHKLATINNVDYSDSFNNTNGCAVFYNPKKNTYNLYNEELSEVEISPYSTFKIISTLMGLEKGVVKSKDSKLGYDNTIYSREGWNKDITLEDAFKTSCVWYYKKLINDLDKEYVQSVLNYLKYGNCDISAWDENGHNGFWLSSSLKISPKEQVEVLNKIFENKTSVNPKNISLLKEVMLVKETEKYSIYGKTGSANNKDSWFVGFVEKNNENTYFAIRLDDESLSLAGNIAKEIAIDIIEKNIK